MITRINLTCVGCDKKFTRLPWKARRHNKYCSRACYLNRKKDFTPGTVTIFFEGRRVGYRRFGRKAYLKAITRDEQYRCEGYELLIQFNS